MKDCAYFQKGTISNIAFVFSCPGKNEEDCSLPASGQTGDNLEILIKFLIEKNILSVGSSKVHFRITNAWDKVLYADNNTSKRTEIGRAHV